MNTTNLMQVDGGSVVKQGDRSSPFAYELQDEHKKPLELEGQEATLYLVHRDTAGRWSKTLTVTGSRISFTISDVLPTGTYTVEVHCGGYVFPSDRQTRLKIVPSEESYATEEVVTLTKLSITEEVKKQLSALQALTYDDRAIRAQISDILGRIEALDSKVDKDTIYDDTALKTALSELKEVIAEKANTTDLETLKQEIPQPYDDSGLRMSLENLQASVNQKATVEAVEALKQEVAKIPDKTFLINVVKAYSQVMTENRNKVDAGLATIQGVVDYVAGDAQRSQALRNSVLQELQPMMNHFVHGVGMPEGRLTAEVGTLYMDSSATNGAVLWIKRSNTGNTGWRVVSGDTGQRGLKAKALLNGSIVYIRRIDNIVSIDFTGGTWGTFEIAKEQLSSGDYGVDSNYGKPLTSISLKTLDGSNQIIPRGFRPDKFQIAPLYKDFITPIGSVYVGTNSQGTIELKVPGQFDSLPASLLQKLRVGAFSYATSDPWPTTLP